MNSPNQNRSRVRAAALGAALTVVAVLAGSTPVLARVTNLSPQNTVLELPVVTTTASQQAQAQPPVLPKYPDILQAAGVEGNVVAQLVINADGLPLEGSLKILSSSHQLFTASVRDAFPEMRYAPAMVDGRAVKQLIQQTFEFRMPASAESIEAMKQQTVGGVTQPTEVHRVRTTRITATKPPQH